MEKPADLYLIGLTGNIACGKSTVIAMLEEFGAATIDADQVTRRMQVPGTEIYHQIVAAFGSDILTEVGGPIDRVRLGNIVFSDPQQLQRLEAIVHPAVQHAIGTWLGAVGQQARTATHQTHPVAVIDAIKLLEAGWKPLCDAVWVVTCAETQQVERLIHTRGMSEAEARQRINAQPPQASRLPYADVVIDNSHSLEETHAQVVAAWQQIVAG